MIIKKWPKIHHRLILTQGEGWNSDHSLKDFGTKDSQLIKLPSSIEAEDAFDDNWKQSQTETVFEKC